MICPRFSLSLAAACLLLACLPAAMLAHLSGDRAAILHGELWRLWSAHLVHFSARHALLDAVALFLCGAIAEQHAGSRRVLCLVVVAAPLLTLGAFCLAPDLTDYRGASALALMLGTLAGFALWRGRPTLRGVLAVLALLLMAKIALDAAGLSFSASDLPSAVQVAWQAHLLGAFAAAAWHVLRAADAVVWRQPRPRAASAAGPDRSR